MSRRKLPLFSALALLACSSLVLAQSAPKTGLQTASLPLLFEANQGQTAPQARYLARSQGAVVFLTAHGVVVKTAQRSVAMDFLGATSRPQSQGLEKTPAVVHYLSAGRSLALPSFAAVLYRQLYPGVDARFYGHNGALEYDLDLAPHASPDRIRVSFRGAAPRLAADGSLQLGSGLSLRAPHAYQQRNGRSQAVAARYIVNRDATVSLALGAYNPNAGVVIDPILTFSAYLGGTALNQANAVAADSSGNGYVAGYTLSADFPVVTGAYQSALAAGSFGPAND
ncbi:MAG TPA: SBBP repeat-containing protein, partial [Terriglobales bacterium]|nr:SBBP repeat-containing protein [Terriglobales bacterium]